jgi:hypothetical protein
MASRSSPGRLPQFANFQLKRADGEQQLAEEAPLCVSLW